MWTCPRCGEPHEDRFSDCWKCVGAEMQTAVSAEPIPAAPMERKLRPVSAFVARGFIGFCIGAILTMAFASVANAPIVAATGMEMSLARTSVASLIGGLVLGTLVGVFVWVVFPYEAASKS